VAYPDPLDDFEDDFEALVFDRGKRRIVILDQSIPDTLAEAARLCEAREHNGLVDAATLAKRLGVSRDFVYDHATRLGGIKLRDGRRGPLRFDVERAKAALAEDQARPRPRKVTPRRAPRRPLSSPPHSNGPAVR
jgi:hypothetical protein